MCFTGSSFEAVNNLGLTFFQVGTLVRETHKRPIDPFELQPLTSKREVQCIGLPVKKLYAELPTGPCPGFFGFPDIGIDARGWIVTERARTSGCRLLNGVDRS